MTSGIPSFPPRRAGKPKRVLVWCWSHGGGGSQFATNLAHRLAREFGGDRVALSLASHDPTVEVARARGLNVRTAAIVSDRRRLMESLFGLAKSANTIGEHAADCSAIVAAMNFAMLAPLSTSLRKPLMYCAHDPQPHAGDYSALAQRATQAWLLHRADRVVAHSSFAADILGAAPHVRRKLMLAPLGAVFEPEPLSTSTDGPVRFLFAGRMIAYKGLDILADAIDLIEPGFDWTLTLAGAGPAWSPKLHRRFARANVEMLTGAALTEQQLKACYARSDILLAPYIEASQSGVVAEALALGRPSIVTPVGALPEQIGHGEAGWVAASVCAQAFASAMNAVLANREAIAEKARGAARLAAAAWASESWSWIEELLA